MNNHSLKRLLAWLGIIVILALFLYISIQSYQVLTSKDTTAEPIVNTVSQSANTSADSRVNWPEVVVLLTVGAGLVYAIRKTNDGRDT